MGILRFRDFTLDEEGSYVIYAYAVDQAGNQSAYICSDGIVIDNVPPVLTLTEASEDGGLRDTSAVLRFRMNETGSITCVLRQEAEDGITEEDIFAAADKKTGSVTAQQAGKDVELYFDGLKANTAYCLYAVGTDAAGNNSEDVVTLAFTTLKSAITGRVSLTGEETYGETLTVSVHTGTANPGEIFYRWYRVAENGNEVEIAGAAAGSYTLTAADIGYGIRVKVTAENCSGSLTAETGGNIRKADLPAENMPVNGQVNDGPEEDTFTFTGKSGVAYEYSVDGGSTWGSENSQSGFRASQAVPLAIRLKATDTHNQSAAQTVVLDLAKESREAPPAFDLVCEANDEKDYTVTIPFTEGCEYSFDGEHWSDDNVKSGAGVGEIVTGYKRYKENTTYNAGSAVSASEILPKFTVKTPVIAPAGGSFLDSIRVTITCGSVDAEIYYTTDGTAPDRSSARYTGAFTVTAPATVKAIAIKEGMTDSAVATAVYTKQSSGGSGGGTASGSGGGESGNGGGNETASGTSGEGSGNSGQGNRNNNAGSMGSTAPGRENASDRKPVLAQGTKQPFIKGRDGKIGWDVIRAEEEQAEEGSVIHIDMNGSTVVPGDIFNSIRGRDIVITFDMGEGILWSVDGKSILTEKAGDIDFSVKKGANAIPVDIINNVSGERCSIQISLAYEGEFGFTAVLSIDLGSANAGYTASLYYYRESTEELELICANEVAKDGTVSLAFTHASDYVIVIEEEEEGGAGETSQPKTPDETEESGGDLQESFESGRPEWPWWIIVVILFAAAVGTGAFRAVKKREKERD